MPLDTVVVRDDPPEGNDHEQLALDIEVDVEPTMCEVRHAGTVVARVHTQARERVALTTIVWSSAWLQDPVIEVNQPHQLVSAAPRDGAMREHYLSTMARPSEDDDVITGGNIELGNGWAPREQVGDGPARWIGGRADVHVAGDRRPTTLELSGVAGPCLGRKASIELHVQGRRVQTVGVDFEDGQPFDASFDLGAVRGSLETLTLRVRRPQPRYTPHDVRVLNLLIREVVAR